MDHPVKGTAELTLAQALLSAGATNVILTLWRIDDAGAGTFAQAFYSSLSRLSANEALAQAQRHMAVDARYGNPFYWAGYLLAGTGAQDWTSASVSVVADTFTGKTARPASRP